MSFIFPNVKGGKYIWTLHSRFKMKYYGISESKVKNIINNPARYEEGIVPNTVAVMQPANTKKYSEIWVMYKVVDLKNKSNKGIKKSKFNNKNNSIFHKKAIKIITAWRYPGKSPKRNPIPLEILSEIENLLN